MPYSFTPDNTAPEVKALPMNPIALPEVPDASSDNYDGTGAAAVVITTPAAPDNTPAAAIT